MMIKLTLPVEIQPTLMGTNLLGQWDRFKEARLETVCALAAECWERDSERL